MEQLLLREKITLDSANIEKYILKKKALITGAAGSIGSELLKQLIAFDTAQLLAIDQNEAGIHTLQSTYRSHPNVTPLLADVTDSEEMERIFQDFRPQIIFHAAAYKHVTLLEAQPHTAVKNNTIATKILADLAVENGIEKFIFISTDKAVNPISIMGMSKRISELYLLSLSEKQIATQFVITRFGNVLGSSGSVVPIFNRHIELNEPVPVTHPAATRYFMTACEAAQLVLESVSVGRGGDIMIFDMGQPLLILDLAYRLGKLHHSKTGKVIEIRFIGLQPGEKMHEELSHSYEKEVRNHAGKMKVLRTDHGHLPKIYKEIGLLHDKLATIVKPDQLNEILRNIFGIH
ncbi:polysaccharide biosynthesis protein [Dyadobacter sp. CY312]|uniref:polysaccharide biosynthesis protein n=1 Tax=Dyadobacter sp. CY312 TaxID=2907303 RepID=UPI001F3776B7|nr:polysaccharide biosynthesis protein [Dyadobacter sp. CY312]MCE7043072.1 polysaccharide biosynthesis protein [Dyadobacter sp. CY312]